METTNSNPEVVPPINNATVDVSTTPTPKKSPQLLGIFTNLPLRLKLALGALMILLLAILVLMLFSPRPQQQPTTLILPSPSPQASFSPLPQVTSEFSKTDEFSTFEQNITILQKDATGIDFDEKNLSYPLLDMQVNFGGQNN